ncbi:hypothetical protein PYW08_012345 [Mythimna loreyi]|uniref:Uncharacterized protein n=1 Tax=Mythimna loreyi TaxID=667449 RepID=A0ACC2Q011_9NEOP|nr:hypothetical protein PYW08_012345 [Mythimna loreyi]
MADDDDGESFKAAIDAELSRREEELRCLEELREEIGFRPRQSLARTPPSGFQAAGSPIPPIREECLPPDSPVRVAGGKRPLSSPQESQGRPTRTKVSVRSAEIPPVGGIMTTAGVGGRSVGFSSPPPTPAPEATSTPNKTGLASMSKTELIDQAYRAVKGISGVANATNKLNMADKGLIAGYNQDILAVVAALTTRLAEMEQTVIAKDLRVATLELQQASVRAAPVGKPVEREARMDYAAILKLPNGKPRVAVEQRGPAVLFYPNSEGIKSSDETLKELREKVRPGQSGIMVEGVRRVGNAGVVVQTAAAMRSEGLAEGGQGVVKSVSFREKGVDYERFRSVLHSKMGRLQTWKPAQEICSQYTDILTCAAETCLGVRGSVTQLTGDVLKFFLEGPAASSRTRLSNNRSVMPLDVLGRTRATLKESACSPWPRGPGNPLKLLRAGDWGLQLSPINEEFLVSASHKLALITSLPFVHTARRYYRLNDLVRSSDRHAVASRPSALLGS